MASVPDAPPVVRCMPSDLGRQGAQRRALLQERIVRRLDDAVRYELPISDVSHAVLEGLAPCQ